MMTVALLFAWFALLVLPDVPARRALERVLVEAPARKLNHINKGLVIVTVAIAMLGLVLFHFLEQDGLLLFNMAAPELAMMLGSVEMTTLIDVVASALMLSAGLRVKSGFAQVTAVFGTRAPRRIRARRTRLERTIVANDDEDRPAGLQLAA